MTALESFSEELKEARNNKEIFEAQYSNSSLTEPACIIDGAHGIYVPQVWAERYGVQAVISANVDEEDVRILLSGPDEEFPDEEYYWETWERVLNDYSHEVNGVKHFLRQDGDLFEYPETYEFEEI
jgi:hypothetical protein